MVFLASTSMEDGLFEGLLKSIREHPNRDDAVRLDAQRRLETAIKETLRGYIPSWKRNGGMGAISVICALPASDAIKETEQEYVTHVYGAAQRFLLANGFVETEYGRWSYSSSPKT